MTDSTVEDGGLGGQAAPAWLGNLASVGWRALAVGALVVVLAYLGAIISTVLVSIGLAIVVSVILAPLVLRMRDGGRSRNSAAGIVWAATLAVAIGVLVLLAISFVPYLVELVEHLRNGQAEADSAIADLGLPVWLSEALADAIAKLLGVGGDALSSAVGTIGSFVGILILGSFLLFFFLRDGDKAWAWMFQWIDEEKRERIDSAGGDALQSVGTYVRGTTALALVASGTNFIFMLALGTPLAVPLAILTLITAYVPYFGGLISAAAIVLVTWGAADQTLALVMVGLIFLRYVIVRLLVLPRVHESAWRMHPVLVLIVLPIGLQVAGLAGLILAVPLTAVGISVAQAAVRIIEPDTEGDLPEMVPAWLDAAAQWSWRSLVVIAFVGVLLVVLTRIPLVVLPIIVALILAATLAPLVGALIARGQSRTMATALAVGGSTGAIIGVLALAIGSLAANVDKIGDTAVAGADEVNESADGILGLGSEALEVGVDLGVSLIGDLASQLAPLVLIVVLSVLMTFYFLRDGAGIWATIMGHLPDDAASQLDAAGGRAFSVLGGYMVGTGAISLVGAGSQAAIMWLLGLPLVMPVFVLSFFGGFIPYIGSMLTTMLAFFIAVAVGDTIDIIVMGIWTLVFNIVQGNVVAPIVYNRTTHIHPAIVLAAIPAGSAVAGILGMFLVVPVLGVVTVSWRSVVRVMGTDLGEPVVFEDDDDASDGSAAEATDPGETVERAGAS